jgi:ActR/RegA family two-component response regulator
MLPEQYSISAPLKALLVDDDEIALLTFANELRHGGFHVATATNVPDALRLISLDTYDVLLSDFHMPGPEDGLTIVAAMRHHNPQTVTMLLTSFPEVEAAAAGILPPAAEILFKSMDVSSLVDATKRRIAIRNTVSRLVESVATTLERALEDTVAEWLELVQREDTLVRVPLSPDPRCGHLPQVFADLVHRLRSHRSLGSEKVASTSAVRHGTNRLKQGYTAAMMMEESRILQICIFNRLQKNMASIDFSVLLMDVVSIADEVDSQLTQAMESYVAGPLSRSLSA